MGVWDTLLLPALEREGLIGARMAGVGGKVKIAEDRNT